jgi:predicted nucleotidyltransferase
MDGGTADPTIERQIVQEGIVLSLITTEELRKRLADVVAEFKKREEISAFYLFGSYAAGCPRTTSDVDVAILLSNIMNREIALDKRLSLMAEIAMIIGTDNLDVLILNEAPASLAFRVLKDGQLLYLKKGAEKQLVRFKAQIFDRYCDYQPVQQFFSAALAGRIKEGSFGGRQGKD